MKKELLELLQEEVGCTYISDLRTKKYNKKGRMAFEQMDLSNYETSVVDDARKYLFEVEQI